MRIDEATIIPAAQDLLAYIRESEYSTIPAFCEAKGLDRLKVARAIKGEILRVDVDFAFAIERATGIQAEGWCTDDEIKAEFRRRREARSQDAAPESESKPNASKSGAA